MKKKKFSFSFHSLLSFSLHISHNFLLLSLFFPSLLLALTPAVLQDWHCPHTLGLHFFIHPSLLAEWPLYLFHHLFLLFFLPHSSHQVTINTSHLVRLCFHQNLFLQLSLAEWPLPVSFLLSSACATHCGSLLIKRSQTSHKSWSESSDMLIKWALEKACALDPWCSAPNSMMLITQNCNSSVKTKVLPVYHHVQFDGCHRFSHISCLAISFLTYAMNWLSHTC